MTLLEASARIAELKRKMEEATPGPYDIHAARSWEWPTWWVIGPEGLMIVEYADNLWGRKHADAHIAEHNALPILLSGMETLVRIAGMPCAEFVEEEPDCRARVAEIHWCATCQARAAIEEMK